MPVPPGWTPDRALDALLEALDEGVLVFDEAERCRAAGRRVGEILGVDPRALIGHARGAILERVAAISPNPAAVMALVGEALPSESTVADPIVISAPHPCILVWTSTPVVDAAHGVGRVDVLRDVTRERRAERAHDEMARRLEQVSTLDDLTGLVNQRRFDEECQREHRRAQREWVSYAVARFDVDGMAAINERLGRAMGDELLRRLGEELKSARREYDVVGRWMDDEFIVLLPRADARAAKRVVKRALAGFQEKGREIAPGMTACVGVAVWTPPSGDGPNEITVRAGEALATARAKGVGALHLDAGFGEWKDDDKSEG